MTVAELIFQLEKMPPDAKVYIPGKNEGTEEVAEMLHTAFCPYYVPAEDSPTSFQAMEIAYRTGVIIFWKEAWEE